MYITEVAALELSRLCKHNSSWLANYTHACTNETHSIANLQYLILGIKYCRFAIECVSFVHAWV